MILPTGKGRPWMCQTWDAKRIENHIQHFNAVASKYMESGAKSHSEKAYDIDVKTGNN